MSNKEKYIETYNELSNDYLMNILLYSISDETPNELKSDIFSLIENFDRKRAEILYNKIKKLRQRKLKNNSVSSFEECYEFQKYNNHKLGNKKLSETDEIRDFLNIN